MSQDWQEIVKTTRDKLAAAVDAVEVEHEVDERVVDATKVSLEGVLSAEQLEITEESVGGILDKLAKGECSAAVVLDAFCRRAIVAHKYTNCLTDIFFDKARERAKFLDDELKKTGKVVGPLHGLPVSLKCQIDVEGLPVNMGYVGWTERVAKKNAVLVDILLKSGAIIYCYTNVPQALMSGETINNLYGRTVMPRNRNLSSGGSSGGEGALVGFKGSPIGVGSDIGGSIRIPSAFNGVYGLRPSYNRIPYGGATNSMEGFEAIPSVLGPISTTIDGLKTFFRAVVDAEPWRYDPFALHVPWRQGMYDLEEHNGGKALCFGLMSSDGVVKPTPPVLRGLEMVKAALEAQGHTVIDYCPPNADVGGEIINALFSADGGKDIQEFVALSGEPTLHGVMDPNRSEISTLEYWRLCLRRRDFITEQLNAWEATSSRTGTGRPIDALIAPPAPYTSFTHDAQQYIGYTAMFNLTDQSVGIVPVTTVQDSDVKAEPHEFKSEFDKVNYERYDPKVFAGAPVAVQVVGRKGEEEAVLRMTEICDAALKAAK
ncbi:hypothetical protein JCM10212_000343 [Sporobolomyces blumeae]